MKSEEVVENFRVVILRGVTLVECLDTLTSYISASVGGHQANDEEYEPCVWGIHVEYDDNEGNGFWRALVTEYKT